MIFGKMKTYGLILLSGLLSASIFLLKIFFVRSKRMEKRAEEASARAHHAKVVMTKDKEIELEHDVRTEELAKQVESDGVSDELSKPNEW